MATSTNHETAYLVKIKNPMFRSEYIVIASGFDRAAAMALAAEHQDGASAAKVAHVEVYGEAGCVLGETR